MEKILTFSLLTYIFIGLASCANSTTQNSPNENDTTANGIDVSTTVKKSKSIFENTKALTSALSQNGIGELKEWSNPMETGWGSLTDYYQFGNKKDGVGMQNNIAYYLEGNETTAKTVTINLNINNLADKKSALKFLSEVTERTFHSLNLELPNGLIKAILTNKSFKSGIQNFTISAELDKSKIETWKVTIVRK